MGNTENDFGKKRDHNQYGEVAKDEDEKRHKKDLPKTPNKGTENSGD